MNPTYKLTPDVIRFIAQFGDPSQVKALDNIKSGTATNQDKLTIKTLIDRRSNLSYEVITGKGK